MVSWAPGMRIDRLERDVILAAFKFYHQNKTTTAASLGIAIRTLENKLEKYAKEDEAAKEAAEDRDRKRQEYLDRARGIKPAQWDTPASLSEMAQRAK